MSSVKDHHFPDQSNTMLEHANSPILHGDLPTTNGGARWPAALQPLFERAFTCEFATLSAQRVPITYPLTPYISEDGTTLDVSTGLAYPAKAERARRNPQVALLYSDPVSTGLNKPPVVLVQGQATVRDADVQANTDRYIRLSMAKVPEATKGLPAFVLRQMHWYFARIWISVTPMHIFWWPEGQLDRAPEVWQAPPDLVVPPSDPAPRDKAPAAWKGAPNDWRAAAHAVTHLGAPILTTVTADGFPLPMRVKTVRLSAEGFRVELPAGVPPMESGPACLTFHTHAEVFTGQENVAFVGTVQHDAAGSTVSIERQLGSWSITGSKLQALWGFIQNGHVLAPRLELEAQRRGQAVPVVRVPKR